MASSLEESVDSSIQDSAQDEPSIIQDSTQDSSVQDPSSLANDSTVESSFDATQESAVTESNTDGGADCTVEEEEEDDDDELLALRIAALESIQYKKDSKKKSVSRPGSPGQDAGSGAGGASSADEDQTKKPDFVIKKHDQRTNLVSIVTGEEEIEQSLTVPPPQIPMVFNYPPPLGLVGAPPSPIGHHPDKYRYPPPTYRSRSRSPSFERRRSMSPRRYRSPPRRYGSLSPPYRSPPPLSRRSPDRRITPTRRLTPTRQLSPTNRRYTSPPPPLGRRMTPPQYRRSPGERWSSPPPGRRSPPGGGGLRRSPYSYNKRQTGRSTMHRGTNYRREPFKPRTDNRQQHRKSLPDGDPSAVSANKPASDSEWETDTDPPTDEDDAGKSAAAKSDTTTDKTADADKSKDSVKGEAASEKENTDNTKESKVDDNGKEEDKSTDNDTSDSKKVALTSEQSHDDVLKLDASAEVDEFSKFLNEIEDEVLNEKKEEKKEETKQKEEKKQRIQTERKTLEGKKLRKKIKPKREGTPSFSDEDNSSHQRNRQPGGGRFAKDWRDSVGNNGTQYSSDRGRDSKNREDKQQWEERRERERKEYEERVERRERERKEYEERQEKEKKEYDEKLAKMTPLERERLEARRRKFEARGEIELNKPKKISLKRDTVDSDEEDARSKLSLKKRDSRSSLQGNDKSDQWRRERSLSPADVNRRQSPPGGVGGRKQHVTDLRVQLHKKKQLAGGGGGRTEDSHQQDHNKESFNRKSAERNVRKSAERNNGRKVRVTERDDSVEVDDDLLEDNMEDGRVPPLTSTHRVIMPPMFMKEKGDVSETSDRSPSPPRPSSRGARKVKMRPKSISPSEQQHNDDLDIDKLGFTEEEVQKEMKNLLSQRKKKKKGKKEKKEKKKLKKEKKKSSKSKLDKVEPVEQDDFMNELDHFEKMLEAGDDDLPDFRSRSKSGSRNRNSSGSKSTSRSRHSSSLSDEMKLSIRAASTDKFRGLGDSLGSKLKQRLGQKVKEERVDTDLAPLSNKRKMKRKSREIQQSDEENEEMSIKVAKKNKRVIHSNTKGLQSDEENEDLILKMAKKNKKRLERAKEIELDRLMHS